MRKKKGFTLIELLVVISIISLLSSIILVNFGTVRRKARYAAMLEFLGTLSRANEATLFMHLPFDDLDGSNRPKVYGDGGLVANPVRADLLVEDGMSGKAAEFNGTSDSVSFNIPGGGIQMSDVFGTIIASVWVYPTLTPAYILKDFPGIGYFGYFAPGNSALAATIYANENGSDSFTLSTTGSFVFMRPNEWAHLTLVVRASEGVEFYVDGRLIYKSITPTATVQGLNNSAAPKIGLPIPGYYFKGKIDDVRIYLSRPKK